MIKKISFVLLLTWLLPDVSYAVKAKAKKGKPVAAKKKAEKKPEPVVPKEEVLPADAMSENETTGLKNDDAVDSFAAESEESKINFNIWSDLMVKSDLNSKKSSYDLAHVYLIAESQVTEKLRGYSEIEFEHGAIADEGGEIKVERAFGEYAFFDWFKFRFGKMLNDYGLWNRYHWQPLTSTASHPFTVENKIIPKNGTGVALFGSFFLSDFEFGYSMYSHNGKGATPDKQDSNSLLAGGSDLFIDYRQKIRIGFSTWFDKNGLKGDRDEKIYVAYIRLGLSILRLDAEYLMQTGDMNLFAWYAQPGLQLHDYFGLFYRFDYTDKDEVSANANYHMRHVGSLVFTPLTKLKLKTEYYYSLSDDVRMNHDKGILINLSIVY